MKFAAALAAYLAIVSLALIVQAGVSKISLRQSDLRQSAVGTVPGLAREHASSTQSPLASGKITGVLLGDDGHPLVFALVGLSSRAADGKQGISRSVTTNDEGEFRFENLPPGDYQIAAQATGYWGPAKQTGSGATRVIHPGDSVTLILRKGGVISGKVTDLDGAPVIAAYVSAVLVRESNGSPRPASRESNYNEALTDDRGEYRIFGLPEGGFIVKVDGRGIGAGRQSAYDENTPVYYPSDRRATATELAVQFGNELTSIDIHYRAEPGYNVAGIVKLPEGSMPNAGCMVRLTNSATGSQFGYTYTTRESGPKQFAFDGIPEGEYTLIANITDPAQEGGQSEPVQVQVYGGDVSGVVLSVLPYGGVSGDVVLESRTEPLPERCRLPAKPNFRNVQLTMMPSQERARRAMRDLPWVYANDSGPFSIKAIPPGNYLLLATLYQSTWFLRSIAMPSPGAKSARPMNIARDGLTLKPGERAENILVTIGEGAGYLSGKVVASAEGTILPQSLRVVAVPAEPNAATDAARFFEAEVREGRYSIHSVAPGRYWLVAREGIENDLPDSKFPQLILDAASRAKLLREARAAKIEVEVRPCESAQSPVISFGPASAKQNE